jgi:hypothetical protein
MSKTRYFLYYERPVKVVADVKNITFWILDGDTGAWILANRKTCIDVLLPQPHHGLDVRELESEEEFIHEVERWRAKFIRGEGEVFCLYMLMNQIETGARDEKRKLTSEEQQLLENLRIQSHQLFEKSLNNSSL